MILTGVLASSTVNPDGADGLLYGGNQLFLNHILALAIVAVFTFGGSFVLFKFVNTILPIRVKHEQEEIGLDISQHGEQL